MDFRFSDDQRLFQSTVRDLLTKECTAAHVRAAWDSEDGLVPGLWDKLADIGVMSLLRPEANGGMGGDMTDLVLLLEEVGRAATPGPVLEAAAVVAPVVHDGVDGVTTVSFSTEKYVVGAAAANGVLLLANDNGIWLTRPHFTVYGVDALDRGRRIATVSKSGGGVRVQVAWQRAFDHVVTGAAAQLVGLADAMITMTGEYAKEREQFGKPIGSFQAVKHHMANALLKLEFARPAVYRAAHALASNDADATRDASMAKVMATDAALLAARVALQVHGAIGYTWEHDLHLWMKSAWSLAKQYGDTGAHLRTVGHSIGVLR